MNATLEVRGERTDGQIRRRRLCDASQILNAAVRFICAGRLKRQADVDNASIAAGGTVAQTCGIFSMLVAMEEYLEIRNLECREQLCPIRLPQRLRLFPTLHLPSRQFLLSSFLPQGTVA